MNFRHTETEEEPEVSLIPFIDVLLVILIFLMISTTFNRLSELKVDLPTAQASEAAARTNELVVGVDANGQFSLEGKTLPKVTVNSLAQTLQSSARSKKIADPVINIYADAKSAHQQVVTVMEAARQAGFGKIVFSTKN